MMKNTEWGAVAYLSHSEFGINKLSSINSKTDYHIVYTKENIKDEYIKSTTGTIQGIYDMLCGAWEYVMDIILKQTQ